VKGVLQPTCFTCKKKITGDKSIEAIGKIYHVTCLVCEVCKAPLKGDFYLKGDKLVCKKELRVKTNATNHKDHVTFLRRNIV
jgi:NAD-dependent SIR2 family protein deacetylase